jgi:ferritin-like metal-binding protein YciE
MAKAAYNEDLADAFNDHYQVTQRQVERLEKVFDRLQMEAKEDEKCAAMEGLIKE